MSSLAAAASRRWNCIVWPARGVIVSWAYEARTFVFAVASGAPYAYTPDFRVDFGAGRIEWHEVKGWLDPASITRLGRMRETFPNERVVIIDETWFRAAKSSGLIEQIPGWESSRARGARGC